MLLLIDNKESSLLNESEILFKSWVYSFRIGEELEFIILTNSNNKGLVQQDVEELDKLDRMRKRRKRLAEEYREREFEDERTDISY